MQNRWNGCGRIIYMRQRGLLVKLCCYNAAIRPQSLTLSVRWRCGLPMAVLERAVAAPALCQQLSYTAITYIMLHRSPHAFAGAQWRSESAKVCERSPCISYKSASQYTYACCLACASSCSSLSTNFPLRKGLNARMPSFVQALYVPAS